MNISSSAFAPGATIPREYTQFGDNISPPLTFSGVPRGAVSLALIMDDPDVPVTAPVPVWDHWVVFNIPTHVLEIPERWIVQGVRGTGTRGSFDYSGPKPPDREHRYFFKLYALDALLSLPEGATKAQVEEGMKGHILAEAELIGLCSPAV